MTKKTITMCDICGITDKELKDHWSICIDHILISFKNHAGVQRTPFDGDICTKCAKELESAINNALFKLRDKS